MSYHRILLKLSGEALGDPESGHGFHTEALQSVARQVASLARKGVEVAMVCGGGNILRGASFSASESSESVATSRLSACRVLLRRVSSESSRLCAAASSRAALARKCF